MTYANITATLVLYNEEARTEALLTRLRPFFERIVVGVQQSSDRTREIVAAIADDVVDDACHGYGDATYGPRVLPRVASEWSFKVDGDELPTVQLLGNLGSAVSQAETDKRDGVWVPFRSWIDDIEWEQAHSHLRLFRTRLGWPGTLHSRPPTDNVNSMPIEQGWIEHRKSLDEHVRGYLTYLRVGKGHPGWDEHNTAMIYHSCLGTARVKGWDYVKAHDWWPEVEKVVFSAGIPTEPAP